MSRLLFVHAHPDDESLANGFTMAHYADAGDQVHLVTCTLGQEGEVIPPELRHLELPAGLPRDPSASDPLADLRREELRCATTALGVTSAVLLPDLVGRPLRDSGMAGSPSAHHPDAFSAADPAVLGAALAAHIDDLRIDAVVTYDRHGGYGHPDHIQTYQVAREAVVQAARRPALFATLTPLSWAIADRASCASAPAQFRKLTAEDPYPPSVVPDEVVTHVVTDDPAALATQRRALECHRTQVQLYDGGYALSNDIAAWLPGREAFAMVDPITEQLVSRQGWTRGLLS